MFLYPLAKAGHWETEKAGYKNADRVVYMMRVTRPALVLSRKCVGCIEVAFLFVCFFPEKDCCPA